jgi:hypothetical protein
MRVIFCFPGREFSDNWVRAWTDTVTTCGSNNIEWAFSMAYDPVVYYARNRVLGGNNVAGKNQKPFGGTLDYDYQVWIDSDMVWTGNDVLKLLSHNKPIVSGCYPTHNNTEFPIVEKLDYNKLLQDGKFEFMKRTELDTKAELFPVSYTGFGFVAVAKGVMERMPYPWFKPRWVEQGDFSEFTAEDVGFCWSAADIGETIYVDPTIRVGHQKSMILV